MATLTASIPANYLFWQYISSTLLGTDVVSGKATMPGLKAIDFASGTGLGNVDLIGIASGTLTNVTPGTTDNVTLDLKALTDPNGVAVTTMTKLIAMLILNDATTDAWNLAVGPGGTTPLSSLFTGTTPTITVPGGFTSPVDAIARPGLVVLSGGNVTGLAVGASNKTVKITSTNAAATSVPYRAVFLGRSA